MMKTCSTNKQSQKLLNPLLQELRQCLEVPISTTSDNNNDVEQQLFTDLEKVIVRVLELRAKEEAKKSNMTGEIKTMRAMIDLTPNYARGYLRLGQLYAFQGYQESAIDIFKKGLDMIPPVDPVYPLLEKECEYAKMRSEKRIDFIANLPYEVVGYVVDSNFLTMDAIWASIRVSRLWREKLVQIVGPSWEELYISKYSHQDQIKILPAVFRHVVDFTLDETAEVIRTYSDLFQPEYFPKIQILQIHEDFPRNINGPVYQSGVQDALSCILSTITNTLHTLTLTLLDISHAPSLTFIVATCRNLMHLTFKAEINDLDSLFTGMDQLSHETRLRSLDLQASHLSRGENMGVIPKNGIETLLRCSPFLQYLSLEGCRYNDDIIPNIQQHCPKLNQLLLSRSLCSIGIAAFIQKFGVLSALSPTIARTSHDDGNSELQMLVLGGRFSVKHVQSLLNKTHGFLVTLCLGINEEGVNDSVSTVSPEKERERVQQFWETVSQFNMTSLKRLVINQKSSFATVDNNDAIGKIIRRSPHLHTLELNDFHGANGITDNLMEAIATQKQLSTLYLQRSQLLLSNAAGVRQLLVDLPIEILDMNGSCGLEDEFLQCIPGWKRMKKISLGKGKNLTPDGIFQFTEALAQLAWLSEIRSFGINFTDEALMNFCNCKCLKLLSMERSLGTTETRTALRARGVYIP
ncbi:hypothetical protein BDA99DRAFT_576563 [Phascolomyces articulosus]|uniref:Uncharacterized protein n=1 Tax=Phascolomyces articulosus TaxID=60185 RepID=A0AAD5JXQ2_9FUNG|nr:hypothetical protein BDA99DRAFT_576563 [Phascolomyces articulosus]